MTCPRETSIPPQLPDETYRHHSYPPVYDRLAQEGPVRRVLVPGNVPVWLVTRYAEVRAMLHEPRLIKNPSRFTAAQQPIGWRRVPDDITAVGGRQVSNIDGERHGVLRRAMNPLMSHAGLARFQPAISGIVQAVLERLADRRTADLVQDFGQPIAFAVASHVLGLPPAYADRMMALGVRLFGPEDPDHPEMRDTYGEFSELLIAAVDERTRDPGDDVTSRLIALHRAGELTRRELTSNVTALILGAGSPPIALLAYAAGMLLNDETARRALCSDRTEAVVEELLRVHPPIPFATWRFAAEPFEFAGQRLETGEAVLALLSSANRDPRLFPTGGRISLDKRAPAPHLSFGAGEHYCGGAYLARREARTALPALLHRFPRMALTRPLGDIEWTGVLSVRLPDRIPVHPHGTAPV